jgi:cation diffusion facilitator family transporter
MDTTPPTNKNNNTTKIKKTPSPSSSPSHSNNNNNSTKQQSPPSNKQPILLINRKSSQDGFTIGTSPSYGSISHHYQQQQQPPSYQTMIQQQQPSLVLAGERIRKQSDIGVSPHTLPSDGIDFILPPPPLPTTTIAAPTTSTTTTTTTSISSPSLTTTTTNRKESRELSFTTRNLTLLSLFANIGLFAFKVWVALTANSMAVVASAVDSLLDMVSQLIILLAMRGQQNVNRDVWPLGRGRLEPVGVVVVAALMGSAALQIMWESAIRLFEGWRSSSNREIPTLDKSGLILLLFAIGLKILLYFACVRYATVSSSMGALAEDHRNDVLSNMVALIAAGAAQWHHSLWWIDPVGAIFISLYICMTWLEVGREQADQLVGRAANPDFLRQIENMSDSHHHSMRVDVVRAYHFGPQYLVEIEMVMPKNTLLVEAHDAALSLQRRVEALPEVARAHVHVDYMAREDDEHKDLSSNMNTMDDDGEEIILQGDDV